MWAEEPPYPFTATGTDYELILPGVCVDYSSARCQQYGRVGRRRRALCAARARHSAHSASYSPVRRRGVPAGGCDMPPGSDDADRVAASLFDSGLGYCEAHRIGSGWQSEAAARPSRRRLLAPWDHHDRTTMQAIGI